MTGGLLELVAKGPQDIILTGNPCITYFKNIFKSHTNFSIETIEQTFKGEINFGNIIICKIARVGDLLSGMYLEIDLPKIEGIKGNTIKWIDSIGHHIIDYIDFSIGGQIIDKQYGEWLEIWNELTLSNEKELGFNDMIGKSNLIQGEKTLLIPLHFWFCKNIGSSLPLIALQYHEIEVHIKLNPFNECWYKDTQTFYVTRTNNIIEINNSITSNVNSSFDTLINHSNLTLVWQDLEENIISKNGDTDQKLLLDKSYSTKTGYVYLITDKPKKNYDIKDIRLYCDYIYLDIAERKHFAQNKHTFLIEQIQFNGNVDYTSESLTSKIPLDFNHPCKELIWVNQLKLSKKLNRHYNFSNTINENSDTDPISSAILYINGQERFNKKTSKYFRLYIPYKYHTRIPQKYIYCYNFGLNPEKLQPSGTCNFSRLDNSELFINHINNLGDSTIKVYAINYNTLTILNGIGGLEYSN